MPSLSTSQLIVLWYAGIFIFLILGNASNELYKVLGITVLAGLILYTLKPHPNAIKGKVFLWVLLPVPMAVGLFIGGDLLMDRFQRTNCEAALIKIATEEDNAESDIESFGRKLRFILQSSENFQTPIYQIFSTRYPLFEEELTKEFPAFANCNLEEREEVVERWIKKFGKRR